MRRWLAVGGGTLGFSWLAYLCSPRPTLEDDAVESSAAPLTAAVSADAPPSAEPTAAPAATPEAPAPEAQAPAPPPPPPMAAGQRAVLFARAFDSEPRDAFWANEQEPKVSQLLAADEFSPDELASVTCRHTVCRVVFKVPALASGRIISAQARLLAHFEDAQFVMQDPSSEQAAQLYLLRQDYALEAPKPR